MLKGIGRSANSWEERMKSDFLIALTQLAAERNLPRETVLSAIEAALVSAFRKDSITEGQSLSVKLDPGTGEISVSILKTVVESVTDPSTQISLSAGKKLRPNVEIGETLVTASMPHFAGRIAAQTAKQVVMQRLREAERELVYKEYEDRAGEVFSVTIQRMEPRQIIVDLGRAEAVLPFSEQAPTDRYRPGLNLKVLLKSIELTVKGPELIVSRTEGLLLRRLFEMEVPEIYHGAVEIVAIAREPGFRSKVAVRARQDGVDPVGSCVGLRGVRIQNIVNELQGEKIDVVEWNKDPARFIANALNPSQVMRVDLDADTNVAVAVVPDRQLSLAIGKEGQNARLAAKLTGWSVDIRSSVDTSRVSKETPVIVAESELEVLGLSTRTFNVLKNSGVTTVGHVLKTTRSDLLAIKSFGEKSYGELQDRLKALRLPPTIIDEPSPADEPEQVAEEAPTEAISEMAPESVGIEEPAVAEETVAAKDTADAGQPEEEVTEAAPEPTPEPEQVPAAETAPIEEPLPTLSPEIVEPLIQPEPEPVGAGSEKFASLHDLPENTWAIKHGTAPEPGRIRFAEEIAGLRGGVMARRGRAADGGKGRKRRSKAGRRRR